MKLIFNNSALLAILLCVFSASAFAQTCTVTFQADFRGVTVADPSTIGIRGSKAPLDWDKTLPMQDPDRDGIYTLTVTFTGFEVGDPVEYKYFHSEAGWENDNLGQFGNRGLTLVDGSQKVPVERYDRLDRFSPMAVSRYTDHARFQNAIFVIALGKKRGLGMDAIAQEIYALWREGDDEWPQTPRDWMSAARIDQQSSPDGRFEVLIDQPGQVKFKIAKAWDQYFDQNGKSQGVTKAEMYQLWKKLDELTAASKGWKLDWIEGADNIEITITVKQ